MRQKIGAAAYFETSAKTPEGIDEAFYEALKIILYPPPDKRKRKHNR